MQYRLYAVRKTHLLLHKTNLLELVGRIGEKYTKRSKKKKIVLVGIDVDG